MTTAPGFSSRSSGFTFQQFPQRDEAQMSDNDLKAGWSNSEPAEHAPEDVHPEVESPREPEPGFTNSAAVTAVEGETVSASATSDAQDSSEPARKKSAAKKAAPKKKG